MEKKLPDWLADVARYKELVTRSSELEDDIPPKRGNRSEKPRRSCRIKNTRKRARSTDTRPQRPAYIIKSVEPKVTKKSLAANTALKKVPSIISKATSFEHRVIVENSYTDLILIIRGQASNELDYAAMWNILPKNIDYEKKRFNIETSKGPLLQLLPRRASVFSNDIDQFFRLLSDLTAENQVPLV